jgi:predicted RNA-binding protein with EMAP domain
VTAKEKFFDNAQAVFKERFNEELPRGKFNDLLNAVRNVAGYEASDEDIGLKHSQLLTCYLTEKDKYERATKK